MEACNYNCMSAGMPVNMPASMPAVNPPCQQHEMVAPQQLENMYPKTYFIIQPVVESTCDEMHAAYGPTFTPTQDQLEKMIDGIYKDVEHDVYEAVRESPNKDERQFYGGGRRVVRDLIGILLLNRLIGRRPFYGYPGYSPYPGFYGYPYPGYINPIYGGYGIY